MMVLPLHQSAPTSNIGSYKYIFPRFVEAHMATAKLYVTCIPNYNWSSYMNNATKIRKIEPKCSCNCFRFVFQTSIEMKSQTCD